MTQYLGPRAQLNCSFVRCTSHLTQCTLQNLDMWTARSAQLWSEAAE